MKAQWKKAIKRIAVYILTAALLLNTVEYNKLFVKAETVEGTGEEGGGEEGGPESEGGEGNKYGLSSVSGNEIPNESNRGNGYIVYLKVTDNEGATVTNADVLFKGDSGQYIPFRQDENGMCISAEKISENGTIKVSAAGFQEATMEFEWESYTDGTKLAIALERVYSYKLKINGTGTVMLGTNSLGGDFTAETETVTLTVNAAETFYISSVKINGAEQTVQNPDGEESITLEAGQSLEVTFSEKSSATIIIEGKGIVSYGENVMVTEGKTEVFFLPETSLKLDVTAGENNSDENNCYIMSAKIDEDEKIGKHEIISSMKNITLGKDETFHVIVKDKWANNTLETAIINQIGNEIGYRETISLKKPAVGELDIEAEDYTYEWNLNPSVKGVMLTPDPNTKETTLQTNPLAAGKEFKISVTAVLRGNTEETVEIEIPINVKKLNAVVNEDYTLEQGGESDWIIGIYMKQTKLNNFTHYVLAEKDGAKTYERPFVSNETNILSGLELNGLEGTYDLTLRGSIDNEKYEYTVENLKIDTKAPEIGSIGYTWTESGKPVEDDLKNEKVVGKDVTLTVHAADSNMGSGVSKAVLNYGNVTKEAAFENGNAVFGLGEGAYKGLKITVFDAAGNSFEKELDVNFVVDTTPPKEPAVEPEEGWRSKVKEGAEISYHITCSSDDVAQYEVAEVDESDVDWGKAEKIKRNEAVTGTWTGVWTVPSNSDEVIQRKYVIRAVDKAGHTSEAVEYKVMIDNKAPEISEVKCTYKDAEDNETTVEVEEKTDGTTGQEVVTGGQGSVAVLKMKIMDGTENTESGIDTAAVSYDLAKNGAESESIESEHLLIETDGTVTYTFPINPAENAYYEFSNISIKATDKVGNERVYDCNTTVIIDQKGPVIESVTWNGDNNNKTDYWFNGEKEAHQFEVKASDDTGLSDFTVKLEKSERPEDAATQTIDGENVKTETVQFGEWVYNHYAQGRQNCPDKKANYIVVVTDRFGNTTQAGPKEVRIDKTAPNMTDEDLTYTFENVKTGKVTVSDKELSEETKLSKETHLVNGNILSKEEVVITVKANDVEANGVASGLWKAELYVQNEDGEQNENGEGVVYDTQYLNITGDEQTTFKFTLKGDDSEEKEYTLCRIVLTDRAGDSAGNTCIYNLGGRVVVVDKKAPTNKFDIDTYSYPANGTLTGWYSAAANNGNPLILKTLSTDQYGISEINWYQLDDQKVEELTDPIKTTKIDEPNGETNDEIQDSLEFTQDQDQLYGVQVTDWAGNTNLFSEPSANNTGSRIRIDNQAPEDTVLVRFKDVNGTDNENLEDGEYEIPEKGEVYGKDTILLSVLVKDKKVEGLLNTNQNGLISSDIDKVVVEIDKEDGQESITGSNNRSVRLAEVNGEVYLEFTFNVELTSEKGSEVERYINKIEIWDNAGNKTPAKAEALKDEVKYILDTHSPELTVDYHEGKYVENALFPDTYFYSGDPGVTARIKERYFYPEDMKVNLHEPDSDGTLNQSEWSMGGKEHDSTFSAPSDGKYRFSLEYSDRSENMMVGTDVADGKYVSKYVVMDTTAPKIEITYEYGGDNITDEIYDGNFYAGTVKATVRIKEKNFDPDMVEIEATVKSAENNSGIGVSWDGEWMQENDEVHVNTVTFEREGTYQFTCTCSDIVGHEAERPAQSHFAVDTTKPAVEIVYDLNDPVNEKYYNQTRTATVRVTDRSFNQEEAEFIIETSGPNPAIGEWVHKGGGGCENQPTGHVDSCVYEATVVFAEDGDYSLGFGCIDKAGNESDVVTTDPFTVDQTFPEMTVSYDNNDAHNEYYYNTQRTGTIQITEHNFRPEDVQIVTTAQRTEAGAPVISGWRSEGDVHTTTISYAADADYTFDIAYIDLAGNEAEAYAGDRFIVDTTVPVLAITDIEDKSANNGTVAPGIEWSDINLDTEGVFLSLTGANNGDVTVATTENVIEGGMKIQYQDFPHEKEMDDLYTFHATVEDLAGNVSEQTVLFSVNRFGSVYVFDAATQEILDRYYINRPARLNVTEINVDTLEFKEITYSKNGDIVTMKAGEDYNVTESGTEATWKSYNYDIFEDNFTEEGAYAVTIYSEDRATNRSNNIVKEKEIDFVMDVTAPTVVVTGVDNEEQYNENSRIITIDAADNISLAGVTAYVDDMPVQTFDAETLQKSGGVVTMEIGSSNEWQKLVVKAVDAAGNEGSSDERIFLITRNILIQWYRNRPLFIGSVSGMTGLVAAIIFFLFYKKKKQEEETTA